MRCCRLRSPNRGHARAAAARNGGPGGGSQRGVRRFGHLCHSRVDANKSWSRARPESSNAQRVRTPAWQRQCRCAWRRRARRPRRVCHRSIRPRGRSHRGLGGATRRQDRAACCAKSGGRTRVRRCLGYFVRRGGRRLATPPMPCRSTHRLPPCTLRPTRPPAPES